MKLLFVADPLDTFKTYKDSTFAMMREAVRQGMAADIWVDGSAQRWRGHVIALSGQMGRKTARSLDPSDRFDRDTREAWIAFDGAAPPPVVGLRVYVGLRA